MNHDEKLTWRLSLFLCGFWLVNDHRNLCGLFNENLPKTPHVAIAWTAIPRKSDNLGNCCRAVWPFPLQLSSSFYFGLFFLAEMSRLLFLEAMMVLWKFGISGSFKGNVELLGSSVQWYVSGKLPLTGCLKRFCMSQQWCGSGDFQAPHRSHYISGMASNRQFSVCCVWCR